MNYFVLNESINSRADLGLRITQPPIIPTTKRIVDSIEVDGREGTLTILRGWEDVVFDMKAALIGSDLCSRFREILPIILSAKNIYFSNDNQVYYNIKHVQSGALERKLSKLYEFSLTFTCSPFRYLRNVPTVILTQSGTVVNHGGIFSLPRITVYGTGSRTLTINNKPIILNILSGSLALSLRELCRRDLTGFYCPKSMLTVR